MGYELFIGDQSFSSWSLRGWLLFEQFDIPVTTKLVGLYAGTMAQDLADLAPARLVPTMRMDGSIVVGETLAMAETLAERHPDAGMWPADPAARALARWVTSEMHAGFGALRNDCPMQLLHQYDGFTPSADVQKDLARIEELWTLARTQFGAAGPWLFGEYSIADAFYAPVAARIAGHDLPVGPIATAYVETTLSDPAFRRWRAMGLTKSYDPVPYAMDLPTRVWPGPAPMPAHSVDSGTPENDTCPYSEKEITHLGNFDGRVFGFCNAFCRDKTVNDPLAWPKFAALL